MTGSSCHNLDNGSYIEIRDVLLGKGGIDWMNKEELLQIFPDYMRKQWEPVARRAKEVQEIRLRADRPVAVWIGGKEFFLETSGELTQEPERGVCCRAEDMERILQQICQFSIYAFSDEIRRGYLTIAGGHRVGLAGQIILDDGEKVRNMKYIRCMNIRIAHEIKGVSDPVLPLLYRKGRILSTLILSPPGCGKTTMLRDLIRNVSNGNACGKGVNVSVVDERSEIGGSYMGVAQNDIGMRTDLLDACLKKDGMMMLIRSMAPDVLAVDELGNKEEIDALRLAGGCGCRILATVHGASIEEVREKPYMTPVMQEKMFDRIVVLGKREGRCVVEGVYDGDGEQCLK